MKSEIRDNRSLFGLVKGGKGRTPCPDIEDSAARPARPELPPLVLLSDDAAGHSVRRMTCFADAIAACKHVQFWFPQAYRSRLTAFWALSARPKQDAEPLEAEALVLVRDPRDHGLVSPFSFLDMDSALDFVREEIRCGLDPALVLLYWAVPARIETTAFGELRVSPEQPPDIEKPMLVLWRESRPAAPQPAEKPKPGVEGLLQELARAMRPQPVESPAPAFQGFGSPEGRF